MIAVAVALWLTFQVGAIIGYMIAMSSWGKPRRGLPTPKLPNTWRYSAADRRELRDAA